MRRNSAIFLFLLTSFASSQSAFAQFDASKFDIKTYTPTKSTYDRGDLSDTHPEQSLESGQYAKIEYEMMFEGLKYFLEGSKDDEIAKGLFAQIVHNVLEYKTKQSDEIDFLLLRKYASAKDITRPSQLDPFENLILAIAYETAAPVLAFDYANTATYGFAKFDYPARFVVVARIQMNRLSRYMGAGTSQLQQTRSRELIATVYYWLTKDFRAKPIEYEWVARKIREAFSLAQADIKALEEFCALVESRRKIPTCLQILAVGIARHAMAWHYRGTGFASTISRENLNRFTKHSIESAEYFRTAYDECPHISVAPELMIDIASNGLDSNDVWYWFRKGFAANPDSNVLAMMYDRLQPKWGGSIDELLKFSLELVERRDFETSTPWQGAKYFFSIANSATPERLNSIVENDFLYDTIRDVYFGYLETDFEVRPDPRMTDDYLIGGLVRAAFVFKREADLKEYLRALELSEPFDEFELDQAGLNFSASYGQGYYSIDENSRNWLDTKKPLSGISTNPQAQIRELIAKNENRIQTVSDPIQLDFWQKYEKLFFDHQKYLQGEKIAINFVDGWNWVLTNQSGVRPTADGFILDNTKRDTSSQFTMIYRGRFPGPKVVEYEIDALSFLVESSGPFRKNVTHFTPFLFLGEVGGDERYFGIENESRTLQFGQEQQLVAARVNSRNKGPRKIKIFFDQGFSEVYVDGILCLRTKNCDLPLSEAIGFKFMRFERGVVKIKNLTVQKWVGKPPLDNPAKLIAYYEKCIEDDPSNRSYWRNLGVALHHAAQYEQAAAVFEKALKKGVPLGQIAFYLGDIADRNGDHEQALQHYKQGYLKLNGSEHIREFTPYGTLVDPYPQGPRAWAGWRYAWLIFMNKELRNLTPAQLTKQHFVGGHYFDIPQEWAMDRLNAIFPVYTKSSAEAAKKIRELSHKVPDEFKPGVEKQMECYDNGVRYFPQEEDRHFYLKLEIPLAIQFYDDLIKN